MESDAKLKKQSSLARLFEYAGNYKYLTPSRLSART